ncbi:MAG: cytidine deaminase [Clostridia bacterium]|nr:cytidine deaminase [Clostridia bacterium]MBQ3638912.1 cytidine deaminase [Clostridia bacterium]
MKDEELIRLADEARKNAYAPYSGYTVGAALLASDGSVTVGCNVENASYGATVCAERVAFSRAVADGKHEFLAIAVVGGRCGQPAETRFHPCGICRQVMREFCRDEFRVLVGNGEEIVCHTLGELLPAGFSSDAMKETRP